MSKTVQVERNITQLLTLRDGHTIVTVTKGSFSLWNVDALKNIKTISFPPRSNIIDAAVYSKEESIAMFVVVSDGSLMRFTNKTMDFSKAQILRLPFDISNELFTLQAVSENSCYISIANPFCLYKATFEEGKSNIEEVYSMQNVFVINMKVRGDVLYLCDSSSSNMMSIDMNTKEVTHKFLIEERGIKSVNFCHDIIILTSTSMYDITYDMELVNKDTTCRYTKCSSDDTFVLLMNDEKTVLMETRYQSIMNTYESYSNALVSHHIVLLKDNSLIIDPLPSKPTLSSILAQQQNPKPTLSQEVTVESSIQLPKNYDDGFVMQLKPTPCVCNTIPSFDGMAPSECFKVIEKFLMEETPLNYCLWDALEVHIKDTNATIIDYWKGIKKLILANVIPDYTFIVNKLLEEKAVRALYFILQRGDIIIPDELLFKIIDTTLSYDDESFKVKGVCKDKEQFTISLLSRKINSQTTPIMLSKLLPDKVKYLFEFLSKQNKR